jgi:SAM-dependent MidA family methyltransferase
MKVSRETPSANSAAELPASDSGLVGEIRSEIERTGPMSFARFMELALYHPEHGYYATRADRGTRTGDFLTAPETHPIFGRAIARQLDELWRAAGSPREYGVVEYGAGAGTLAIDMFRGLAADGSPLGSSLQYRPVEISPERERSIRDRLDAEGFGDRILNEGGVTVGCAIANEFLDALPVHRVIQVPGELRELSVDWQGGRFVEVATTPTSPDLAARLADGGIELAIGQQAEICLRLDDWAVEVSSQILRGFVLLIDYGYQARELYRPGRGSTLRGYTGNRAHADPFVAVGRQDLTAHVDFTAVERALARFGWRKIGDTSQAEFLMGVGAEEILRSVQADPGTTAAKYLALRSALVRMLDPRAMGGFRVLLFARDVGDGFTPRGFSFTLRKATVGM